jgi:hypothetical protein
MIIPKQFKLMAHTWTVVHVPGMITDPTDGETCRGLCQFDSLTIRVNVAQAPSMVMHTYLHEVMHAVLWSLGRKECDDENFVDSVAGALTQVLEPATTQAEFPL